MHPIVTVLRLGEGERPIGSYGVLAALGVAVACALAARAAWRARVDVGLVMAALACTIAGGFAGAWLTFGAVELARTGSLAFLERGGGLVFFGAVPGGAVAMLAAGRWLRLDVLRVLELSLPGLAAGHALGRIGCFLGGCCFGRPFDGAWAITYVDPLAPASHPAVPRHPAPLYEAAGLIALGLAFALVRPRHPGMGRRAAAYLGAYCALRLGVEAFRGDAIRGVWSGVPTSTAIAVIGGLAAAAWLLRARRPRFEVGGAG